MVQADASAAAAAAAAAAANEANASVYAADGSLIVGRVENEATMGDDGTSLGLSESESEHGAAVEKPTRSIDTLKPGKMVASKGKVQHAHNSETGKVITNRFSNPATSTAGATENETGAPTTPGARSSTDTNLNDPPGTPS